MGTTGWIILAAANIPLYYLLGRLIFRDWQGFWECVKYWLTPDIISAFRGDYFEDWTSELKLFLWLIVCGVCVAAEGVLIDRVFFG